MFGIRYATQADKEFWFTLDLHMKEQIFDAKIRDRQGYVISDNGKPIGVLRYNLVMTSTQANEQAQHFYRKLGYKDSGCLLLHDDPVEIFFVKQLNE